MRKKYFAAVASAGLLIGCAGPVGSSGSPGFGMAQQGAAPNSQFAGAASSPWNGATTGLNAAGANAPNSKPAGWAEKLKSTFTQNPLKTLGLTGAAAAPQKMDSISLGYPTGKPSPELLLSMASLTTKAGDPARARELYNQVLAADPTNVEALLGLARIEDKAEQYPLALAYYQQAASANPNNATVLNHLGLCLARMERFDEAVLALHAATKLQPSNPLYRNNIATVLVQLNQLDNALAELNVAHPPAAAHYNLAVLLNQQGRPAEAVDFAAKAVQIDPQIQPARNLLASLAPGSVAQTSGAVGPASPRVALAAGQPTTPAPASQGPATTVNAHATSHPYPATGYSPWPTVGSAQPGAAMAPPNSPTGSPAPNRAAGHSVEMPVSAGASPPEGANLSLLPPIG